MASESSSTSPAGLPYSNVGDYYPRKFGPKPDVVPSGVTERKNIPLDKPDMVALDVISIQEPGPPCSLLRATALEDHAAPGDLQAGLQAPGQSTGVSGARGRLLVGTFVALCFNLLTMLSVKNKPFVYVSEANPVGPQVA
ncbi:UNVERIFIED_CONTAM: hypothetical protein FKN15_063131 [Acipenser sinensis]